MSVGTFLALGLLAVAKAAPPEPIVVPYEVLGQELAIRVVVGGTERRMILTTASPRSYLVSAPSVPVEVSVDGRSLGPVLLGEPGEGVRTVGEDGGLGMDVLKGMAVGVDELRRRVTIWPKGALPADKGEGWVLDLPARGASKARRLKMGALPAGSPSVEAMIDGKRVPAVLRLGFNGTFLESSVSRPDVPIAERRALLAGVSLAGLPPSWLVYLAAKEGTIERPLFGVSAALAVNSLDSRRVLVDFAADALYVEELPEDARLSYFFARFTKAPLELRGDGLFVHIPEGVDTSAEPQIVPFEGSQALRIAGVRAGEWVEALRGKGDAGARRLAPLLARLFETFDIDVLTPQGRELSITVKVK